VPQDPAKGAIHLKSTQERVLAAFTSGDSAELTRGQYQELAGVSRSQAAYDLAELVEAGILRRLGGGRATRYRLVRESTPGSSESRPGQRRWTNERIRSELEAFCAGRKAWPSAGEFKASGRSDLYVAASRYGGIGSWAEELGFPRPGRTATSGVAETPVVRKLAWAGAGALASAAVVAAAAAMVVLSLPRESNRAVSPPSASPPATPRAHAAGNSSHVLRKSRPSVRAVHKAVKRTRHVTRHVERTPARPTQSSSTSSLIASRTYSPPSSSAPPTSSGASAPPRIYVSAPAPSPSGGPAPLRAPMTASSPNPLKAP
jgi:hypothetical protein